MYYVQFFDVLLRFFLTYTVSVITSISTYWLLDSRRSGFKDLVHYVEIMTYYYVSCNVLL